MRKVILLSLLLILLFASFVSASSGNFTNPTNAPGFASQGSNTARDGIIGTPSQNVTLYKIEKFTAATCTVAYLVSNSSGSILASSNFSGHVANFSHRLNTSDTYRFLCDAGGASYNRAWNGTPVYPYAGPHVTINGNIVDDGFGTGHYMNIRNITTDNSTFIPPPPVLPVVSFNTPPTPSNNSFFYLKNETMVFNASASSGVFDIYLTIYNSTGTPVKGFCTGCTIIPPSIYTSLGVSPTNSLQTGFNTSFYNLSVGVYYYNVTISNATYFNKSETRTFTIYNLTQNGFTNPTQEQNISSQNILIKWNPTLTTPTYNNTIFYNLSLYNASGFIRTINTTFTNNYTINNLYSFNLSIGDYYFNLTSFDNRGNNQSQKIDFNLLTNALLNITAKKRIINETINVFNITLTNGLISYYNTTSGSILADFIKGQNYNITIRAEGYTTNSTSFSSNQTYPNFEFLLWGYNSLLIYFYDELTQSLMVNKTVFLEIISNIYANNYSTNNGSISIELLDPEDYVARYDSIGYVERFYSFSIIEDSAQTLNLYLLNDTIAEAVTITILDEDTLPLENAIVKALKYDVTSNSYLTVEIGTTNVDGQVVMDLTIGDEFYKFIVVYDDLIVKTTNPSYLYSNSLTIQVTVGEDILNNYDQYKNIVTSLYFENTTNTTVFFYNDLQNLNLQYCLLIYKIKNSSGFNSQTLIGQDCSIGTSDSLTYTLTNINQGDLYLAIGVYYSENSEIILNQLYIDFSNDNVNTGREGLWLQIILTILMLLFTLGMPEIMPISATLSLIFGNLMQLNNLNLIGLFGLFIFSCLITYGIIHLRKS